MDFGHLQCTNKFKSLTWSVKSRFVIITIVYYHFLSDIREILSEKCLDVRFYDDGLGIHFIV